MAMINHESTTTAIHLERVADLALSMLSFVHRVILLKSQAILSRGNLRNLIRCEITSATYVSLTVASTPLVLLGLWKILVRTATTRAALAPMTTIAAKLCWAFVAFDADWAGCWIKHFLPKAKEERGS
jgi:hypothetical protein